MSAPEHLINDLPDPESARRFLERLAADTPSATRKLLKNGALLADVLTLVTYSPLLATTLLQNPEYMVWLGRHRLDRGVRGKEEMLESLARFSLTHSSLDQQVQLARFRRRELLRIYLADIRRQLTVSETTQQLSTLADAILENALRVARQEMDNRYGSPLETDEKGRRHGAGFCVVSLGKLGSNELNYSSDIDLLFIYSGEGETSGSGARGQISNREYFVKLAEYITRMIGQQTGEGAVYRVDLRLRPHGRVGSLALSLRDTIAYYTGEAHDWERQVMIRSRASAGDPELFQKFYDAVEPHVFSESQSVAAALRSVRRSKQKIDFELDPERGTDVKLGIGGIREIEFIAQALQLSYGGKDRWLRSSHTLISLARLAERRLLAENELSQLFEAYDFLRRLEHILQMENGLQTHLVPKDATRRFLVARRMKCADSASFDRELEEQMSNVHQIYERVFSDENIEKAENEFSDRPRYEALISVDASSEAGHGGPSRMGGTDGLDDRFRALATVSPKYADILAAQPELAGIEVPESDNYLEVFTGIAGADSELRSRLSDLRQTWRAVVLNIAALDAGGNITTREAKRRQTLLAEASISAALDITRLEMGARYNTVMHTLPMTILGLGKLGGAGIDYDSDLDIIAAYDDAPNTPVARTEFYSRAVETFVNVLSGVTREGSLYRIDLRLRPHGKNGPNCISARSFAEYVRETAALWELLAYLKIRAAGGEPDLSGRVERDIVSIIFERARTVSRAALAAETLRIRRNLEKQRTGTDRRGVVDIKYGAGGMLDIYFAIRYLQLRDSVPDDPADRSSEFVLLRLLERGSLSRPQHEALLSGYRCLSELDHCIRLTIGRTTKFPAANPRVLDFAARRLGLDSSEALVQQLSLHRMAVREAFESVVS